MQVCIRFAVVVRETQAAAKMTAISADDPDYQYLAPNKSKLQEEQNMSFDGKKNCWIPDQKEGYLKAEIISTKGDDVTVLTEKQEVRTRSTLFAPQFSRHHQHQIERQRGARACGGMARIFWLKFVVILRHKGNKLSTPTKE